VILVLALLITDPATIPREPLAQVAFGLVIAVGMQLVQAALFSMGRSDFWAKVAVVPLANVLAPHLDALARRVTTPRWLANEHNRTHVAAWALLACVHLFMRGKGGNFEQVSPQAIESACYHDAPPGERCAHNRLFCAPFRVDDELACWTDRP
jgi:hypothetical protein